MPTASAIRPQDCPAPSLQATPAAHRPLPASSQDAAPGPESPHPHVFTVRVTGGLDGALRVLTLLHGRRYQVRDVSMDVRDDVVESRIDCTVTVTAVEVPLLLERLRRIPVVVGVGDHREPAH